MNKINSSLPKVYIVLLNYKGWEDTIECVESLFKLKYSNFKIIVVDNSPTNHSIEELEKWARGETPVYAEKKEFEHLVFPNSVKPINYLKINEGNFSLQKPNNSNLILIKAKTNKGFSAGNNVGINYALSRMDANYIWFLNNDTVVESNSLTRLLNKYRKEKSNNIGILGSKIKYYFRSNTLQCAGGGVYNKWLAKSRLIANQLVDNNKSKELNVNNLDFIMGASMFVDREFIERVGLLSEDYFLYFEEIDWAERAKKYNYKLGYCSDAIVYHKEGKSTKSSETEKNGISKMSDFYFSRNKIIITKKFYNSICLLTVYLSFILIALNRIRRGQFNRVPMLFKILLRPNSSYEV